MKIKSSFLAASAVTTFFCCSANGAILITQYYEGPSTNKWIEITNTGTTTVDLSAGVYKLSLWTNAAAEGYKSNTAPTQTMSLTGNLSPGSSFVYGNSGNTAPSYMVGAATANSNLVLNFNGNDSVALWAGASFTTVSIVDAVGFTNAGNEGVDKSFVRLNAATGFNTTSGSNITNFSSVWQSTALTTVDSATAGTDVRIGFSSVPEPDAAVLIGAVGLLGIFRRRR